MAFRVIRSEEDVETLRVGLAAPDRRNYVVSGQTEDSTAWLVAEAVLPDMARMDGWLSPDPAHVAEWMADPKTYPDKNDFPAGKVPVGLCFGWSEQPVYCLDLDQAEDTDTVDAANTSASDQADG